MGPDGRLYCMEKVADARERSRGREGDYHYLAAYDPVTGARVHVGAPQPHNGDTLESLCVLNVNEYAFTANDFDFMKNSTCARVSASDHAGVFTVGHGSQVVLAGEQFFLVHRRRDRRTLLDVYPFHAKGVDADAVRRLELPYRRSYTVWPQKPGSFAYVAELPDKLEGWIGGGEAQPGFDRVTALFIKDGEYRYWALSQGHLFLMRLPVN